MGAGATTGHVAVVGGGIAGLAAAWELTQRGLSVTVLEADDRFGGKIRPATVGGVEVDAGADAFLARVPEATELCREVGLGDELVSPAATEAYLWSGGRLRRLPAGLVLGVPSAAMPVLRSGILGPLGLARAGLDLVLPRNGPAGDESVGALVRRRLGDQVLERLVDPLVGGINAGDADGLSLAAAVPQLADAAGSSRSLVLSLRRSRRIRPPDGGPVFHSLPGGMSRLVDRLVERLRECGATLTTGARVSSLTPTADGYRLEIEAAEASLVDGSDALQADGVVVAVPAPSAAALLGPSTPGIAVRLTAIEHASVTTTLLVFPPGSATRIEAGSGFIVPRREGRLMTACTWASSKWAHVGASGYLVLRVSAGRYGDERPLVLRDDELVTWLRAELAEAIGLRGQPLASQVMRWIGAFPQYAPGHLDRVTALEAELAECLPGVVLAGATYRGVGIPACIRSGRQAATRIATRLA